MPIITLSHGRLRADASLISQMHFCADMQHCTPAMRLPRVAA